MTAPVYAVQLPAGARLLSPDVRLLFFVSCAFAWKPSASNSPMTITEVKAV
jgi:hypothetical protein